MYDGKKNDAFMQSKRFMTPVLCEMGKKEEGDHGERSRYTSPYSLLPLPYRRLVRMIFSRDDLPILFR